LFDRAFASAVQPRGSSPDGLPGSRSPALPSTPGTTASSPWLRSPRGSAQGESSKTLEPIHPRAANSSADLLFVNHLIFKHKVWLRRIARSVAESSTPR